MCNANFDTHVGTALHWAAGKGRADAIKFLVEKGSDIDQNSVQGLPAVLMAAVSTEILILHVR